jgi:Flp pilus assembly protein TadG
MNRSKRPLQLNRTRRKRRGAIVILACILLIMMFAFVAFAVDIGLMVTTQAELQNAADSSALSGARVLRNSPGQARVAARTLAEANDAAGEQVSLNPGEDVEIGNWDKDTATFTVLTGAGENQGNAVRVTCRRTAERGNPLNLFFAQLLGKGSADLTTVAIARMGVSKCGHFVGINSAKVAGGYVDSYDSSLGTYDSQSPGDEGHVCSNGDIDVQNAIVNGDALPGEDHDVSVSGQGDVTGTTDPHPPKTFAPIDIGDADTVNDNDLLTATAWKNGGDNISISSSSSATFPGGTLYIPGSVNINGELRIEGPTKIYVMGDVAIAGQGIINESQLPADLQIFILGTSLISAGKADFAGESDFYGVIYAPTLPVKVTGGAAYFGAIVGLSLDLINEGGSHYDDALDPFNESVVRTKLVQ